MEAGAASQLKVDAVQKTGSYEQCEADSHVTDNTDIEYDPVNYSRYNKVVGLYFGSHHEHSGNHHEGEREQGSLTYLWKPRSVETKPQWMNGAVTE